MARAWLWIRYGLCTGLGLILIGLAAVGGPGSDPDSSSVEPLDPDRPG